MLQDSASCKLRLHVGGDEEEGEGTAVRRGLGPNGELALTMDGAGCAQASRQPGTECAHPSSSLGRIRNRVKGFPLPTRIRYT